MAYENAVPVAVIVGFVTSIIILVLILRWLKHKNRQKEATEKDLEAAKLHTSASDDGAWDALTPVASPRDALFTANVRDDGKGMHGYAAQHKSEREWRAAKRAQGHA